MLYTEEQIREALELKGLFLHERQVNDVINYLRSLTPTSPLDTKPALVSQIVAMNFSGIDRNTPEGDIAF